MPLISTKTIITSLSLFHITLGFFFLTNPITVNDQALVYIIGESMGMPYTPTFDQQSPPLAFLGIVLFVLGLSDLATCSSLPFEVWLVQHWGTQAPLRLTVAFLLCGYSFIFSPAGPLYGSSRSSWGRPRMGGSVVGNDYKASSWGGDGLKNRVFFTFMFVELISWFWVWVTLREERRELLAAKSRRGSRAARRLSQHFQYE